MLSETQALMLLKKYNLPEKRIQHSIGVATVAYELAVKIKEINPHLELTPNKVKTAALLHDIGRSAPGDHEINSIRILNEEGYPELASIVCHGTIYEIMRLRGVDNPALLPHSIENKIVTYADARFRDSKVSMVCRWAEIELRRTNEPEKIRSLHLAKERFFALELELLKLAALTEF